MAAATKRILARALCQYLDTGKSTPAMVEVQPGQEADVPEEEANFFIEKNAATLVGPEPEMPADPPAETETEPPKEPEGGSSGAKAQTGAGKRGTTRGRNGGKNGGKSRTGTGRGRGRPPKKPAGDDIL